MSDPKPLSAGSGANPVVARDGPPVFEVDPIEPRDLLVQLREWLIWHRQTRTQHFGDSDQSGHPHGYAGVVIPEWSVLQRIEEIQAALARIPQGGAR